MFPNIRKRPWRNIDNMVVGLADLLDGIFRIGSLGFYYSDFSIKYCMWRSIKMLDMDTRKAK